MTQHGANGNGFREPRRRRRAGSRGFLYFDHDILIGLLRFGAAVMRALRLAGALKPAADARLSRPKPPAGGGRAQAAKQIQAKPNKSTQSCLDLLGLIWFYLVESGLFNGLQAKK